MNIMIIRNTTGSNLRSIIFSMKTILFLILSLIFLGCSPKKGNTKVIKDTAPTSTIKNTPSQEIHVEQNKEDPDRTEELYNDIKDSFSGSWKYLNVSEIDGEREVSWGSVPFSNQSYFIIDFQNDNRIIIRGATEGGRKGFDRYIGQVLKIEEDSGNYRFTYKNTITVIDPDDEYEVVLRYNPEKDTMAIIGYGDNLYENPSEMIRISEPLHK